MLKENPPHHSPFPLLSLSLFLPESVTTKKVFKLYVLLLELAVYFTH